MGDSTKRMQREAMMVGGNEQILVVGGETWAGAEVSHVLVLEDAVIGAITSSNLVDKDGSAVTTFAGITFAVGSVIPIYATSVAVTSGTVILFR